MTEPKPCPVCRGAELGVNCLELYRQYEAHYVCLSCESEVAPQGPLSEPCGTAAEAEEVALRAWNDFVSSHPSHRNVAWLSLISAMRREG
jgi:hypothetical protein